MRKILSYTVVLLLVFVSCTKESDLIAPEEQSEVNNESTLKGTNKTYTLSSDWESSKTGYDADNKYFTVYKLGGNGKIQCNGGGNFQLSWTYVKNVVGGLGWDWGTSRTIGYNAGAVWGAYDMVGVYGWGKGNNDRLIEYYVVEIGQGDNQDMNYVTTKWSNNREYHIYQKDREDANVEGWGWFTQYKSVRKVQQGTGNTDNINMGTHKYHWNQHGSYGFTSWHKYQVFGIEIYNGSGYTSGGINASVWE